MEIYLDKDTHVEEYVEDLLSRLKLEEKILLLRGKDFWTAKPIPRLKIPSFGMTDGLPMKNATRKKL